MAPDGVDTVLFDCWGTLFTTAPASGPAVPMYVLAEGLGVEPDAAFRDAYEEAFMLARHDGYERPVRRLARAVGAEPGETRVASLVDRLERLEAAQVAYDDALPAVERLRDRGAALALVTNTDATSLARLRERFPVDEAFDAVVASYEVGALKPAPAMFETALDRVGADAGEAAMVGDSPGSDVRAARRLGLRAVLVDRADEYGWLNHEPRVPDLRALDEHV
ncbi:MAG: HAD family hydrolase [Haloferacaceae archaeon]|jgi:putative hydrolase of the HAD superfamily